MAIHNWDPNVVIFANAMGQSHVDPHRFPQCSNPFRGEWGSLVQIFREREGVKRPAGSKPVWWWLCVLKLRGLQPP
jgi:hypothetical protein